MESQKGQFTCYLREVTEKTQKIQEAKEVKEEDD